MSTTQTRRNASKGNTKSTVPAGWAGLLIGSLLILSGCSWGKRSNQPVVVGAETNGTGSWLCEPSKASDDWECIQSEDIEPKLAARAQAASEAKIQPLDRFDPTETGTVDPTTETPSNTATNAGPLPENLPVAPQPSMDQSSAQKTRAQDPSLTTATQQLPQEPAYAQLAYRPDEPVRIIDLPENFYAAQLLAVSTKKQIEDFVVAQNLYNMSAARIEQNGQVLYVLLLGVYETKELAQRAVASMPTPVRSMKPWVRPIAGLQDAMMRGDQLAATAGIQ